MIFIAISPPFPQNHHCNAYVQQLPQVGESKTLESESEGKLLKAAEGEKVKGRKEGGRKRESVEGKDDQVGRKSEGREVDHHQAQVLQSQELLLRRKGSREDQQPMEKEKEPMVKEEEVKEAKGKTKKWTWSEVNLGGNSQQQEEPSLLAILRFFSFFVAITTKFKEGDVDD